MNSSNYYDLNFSQLMYFISAAQHLNFSKAAAECHVVPNVISKQVANIEARFGTPMFDRTGKHVALTEAGEAFYKCAIGIEDRIMAAVHEIGEYDTSINMSIKVGYFDLWSEAALPPIIRDFKQRCPNADVTIRYYNMPQILSRLSNGFIDVILISPFKKISDPNLESLVLKQSPVNLIVSESHPLSGKDEIELSQLKNEYFSHLAYPRSEAGSAERLPFDDGNFTRYIVEYPMLGMEQCQNIHNILFNIRSGTGLGFLPEAARSPYTDRLGIKFIKIKESIPPVQMYVIWNKSCVNPAAQAFIETARAHICRQPGERSKA